MSLIGRRAAAGLLALTLVACNANEAPTGTAPAGTGPAGTAPAGATPAATEPIAESFDTGPVKLPDGLFTTTVDPMIFVTTPDAKHATTVDVGPDGGTLKAKGPDGTAYSLAVPKGSLPFIVSITMTPIASLSGFDPEVAPEHSFGVTLEPQGLELALPATLTVTPLKALPPGARSLVRRARTWCAAGLRYSEQNATSVTMEVDHFSTYDVSGPFTIDMIGAAQLDKWLRGLNRTAEEQLAAEVASRLAVLRQQELGLLGGDELSKRDIARAALSTYRRLVIGRRVAVADQSCANANLAMNAYLEYQRQRQLLGVADDPEFDLPGAGLMLPADLVALAERVCFKEAYERCTKTGDLPSLATYYFTMLARSDGRLGVSPTSDSISLAHGYMRRCGRWRLHLTTDMEENGNNLTTHNTSREFFLQWEPSAPGEAEIVGPGFGFVGSKIEGHGPVDTLRVSSLNSSCGLNTISGLKNTVEASAKIEHIAFDHYEGPTLTGDPLPPVPTRLELKVNLGDVEFKHAGTCPQGDQEPVRYNDNFGWFVGVIVKDQGDKLTQEQFQAFWVGDNWSTTIHKSWQFSTGPFKATYAVGDTFPGFTNCGSKCLITVRLELNLEHDPT